METLYVIGNGFDLSHKIPTSYCEFHKYIIANHTDLEDFFAEYFSFKIGDNYLWTNFEEDLGTFDWKSFFDDNCNIDLRSDSFRPSFSYSLQDDLTEQAAELKTDISNSFQDWLESIDISSIKKKMKLEDDAIFLNFNYTLTLEEVYKIHENKILHIHGDIVDNSGELIFGHTIKMKEYPELDENGDSNRTVLTDSENAAKIFFYDFQKPVKDIILENKRFFKSIEGVNTIHVLGHSLNQTDILYFKEIAKRCKLAKWNVSYHQDHENEKFQSVLNKIGVNPKSLTLFKL